MKRYGVMPERLHSCHVKNRVIYKSRGLYKAFTRVEYHSLRLNSFINFRYADTGTDRQTDGRKHAYKNNISESTFELRG